MLLLEKAEEQPTNILMNNKNASLAELLAVTISSKECFRQLRGTVIESFLIDMFK